MKLRKLRDASMMPASKKEKGMTKKSKYSRMAIASLICGILSVILPWAFSFLPVFFGVRALKQIRTNSNELFPIKGRGMAIAGIVMGGLNIALMHCWATCGKISLENILIYVGAGLIVFWAIKTKTKALEIGRQKELEEIRQQQEKQKSDSISQ